MQVTSLLSRHEHEPAHEHDHIGHDESCSACGHEHEHTPVRLKQTLLGLLFVINAFIVDWLLDQSSLVAGASAMLGAILLGYPIVWTSIKDLKRGIVSINELVGIAVLASFASGDYKTAGVVAFFMLLGEIIETRTAEGAPVGYTAWSAVYDFQPVSWMKQQLLLPPPGRLQHCQQLALPVHRVAVLCMQF